jgi:glycosyltransferase involved in cell wall biosynthesis
MKETRELAFCRPAFPAWGAYVRITIQPHVLTELRRLSRQDFGSATLRSSGVDDGSTDATARNVLALTETNERVKLCSLTRRFGHQAALMCGLELAAGDAVIVMDGDGQHPPSLLPQLIERWKKGTPVVNAIRVSDGGSQSLKELASRAFYYGFGRLTGLPMHTVSADFRLMDRSVVTVINQLPERRRFLRGLVAWLGYPTELVTFTAPERRSGRSKFPWSSILLFGLDAVISFSSAPLIVAFALGLMFAVLGFGYLVYAIFLALVVQIAVPGWASILSVVLLMGGVQLIVAGIQGLYIAKMYDELKGRPMYLVDRTVGINSGKEL